MTIDMPDVPAVGCCEFYGPEDERGCRCHAVERALRAWFQGRHREPMTEEQRDWCLAEIRSIDPVSAPHFVDEEDQRLAGAVLVAWVGWLEENGYRRRSRV